MPVRMHPSPTMRRFLTPQVVGTIAGVFLIGHHFASLHQVRCLTCSLVYWLTY